ncbi:MAG: VWA domain-containing protein [Spirochaetes bacterium]|nr:VWA domain-containing protein [Spirochaetota bacterium]
MLTLALAGFPATHALPRIPQSAPAQAALDLVPVNVRVIDRAGKPVTDLKQTDFTLVEDGVPQQIRHFALETLATDSPQPGAKPVVRQAISLLPQRHRIFVFALGLGRLEEPLKAITALLQFVRTRLLPQDQVAVFAYDRALPFTTDHQKVAETLERFKRFHEDIDFEIGQQLGPTGMAPLYGSRVLSRKLQTKIDEMMFGAGATAATPVADEVLDADAFERLSLDDFMSACARTLQDQGNLRALMEYLRCFEGEKHVLFVTERGLLWPREENDRTLAEAANDGRVSIHALQVGGLLEAAGREIDATRQQALSFKSLRTITSLTGGLSAITEGSQAALDRLDEVTRSSYLLGYRSSNAAWDGRDRTIAVRVRRPDLTVLFRHGYRRDQRVGAFNRRAFVTADRLLAAGNFRRDINDIRVKASLSLRSGSLAVEGKIDLARVKLEVVDGERVGLLNVVVFCLDGALEPAGSHADTITVKVTEEEYKRALKDGFPYLIQFPMIRSTKHIRFIVYDYGSDLIGRADTTL